MTNRIFSALIVFSTAAALAAMALITLLLNRFSTERSAAELRDSCTLIATAVEQTGGDYLRRADFGGKRVTWILPGGKVIFDSETSPGLLGNHADRIEVTEAFSKGRGSSERFSATTMDTTLNYALRLNDGSVLRVSGAHPSFMRQLSTMAGPMLTLLLITGGFSLLYAFLSTKRILKPINDIDLDHPDIRKSYTELAPLLTKLRTQNGMVSRQMEELRRSRDQFSLITESMDEGFIIADPKMNILACNSAALRLLGTETLPDDNRHTIFSLNRSDGFRKCILNAMGGVSSRCILPGGKGECEIIANPVNNPDAVSGIVVLVFDVTERRQLETMRREFTSNVSHELKTPLTVIYGSADMLAGGLVKPEDVADFGKSIRGEADRLIKLIEDIVSLSKLDEDRVTEHEDVDLYELSGEILRRLSPQAEKKSVTCLLSGSKVVYNGSRTILDEIITNLCSNAIKYNKDGGIVEVKTGQSGGKTTITVSDSGIGIPPASLKRIFERFYRADKSRSRKIEGTGLGLSIVKHGAEYHGGTVSAESTPGKGSIFTVTLP